MTWALAQTFSDPAEKLLLVILANYADQKGRCAPTVATLAREVGIDKPETVTRLNNLLDSGFITITPRGGNLTSVIGLVSAKKTLPPPAPPAPRTKPKKVTVRLTGKALDIYAEYPRKVGREKALSAINVALKKVKADDLLAKVKEYAQAVAQWPASEKQYVPNPATWFNQGRWEDDPETWKRVVDPKAVHKTSVERDLEEAQRFIENNCQ